MFFVCFFGVGGYGLWTVSGFIQSQVIFQIVEGRLHKQLFSIGPSSIHLPGWSLIIFGDRTGKNVFSMIEPLILKLVTIFRKRKCNLDIIYKIN